MFKYIKYNLAQFDAGFITEIQLASRLEMLAHFTQQCYRF